MPGMEENRDSTINKTEFNSNFTEFLMGKADHKQGNKQVKTTN